MSAITPNARNHEGLNTKDSRFVDVPGLPWEDTKFPGVKAKTLLVDLQDAQHGHSVTPCAMYPSRPNQLLT